MEYRRLGNSGLKVSELSFGSWVTFVNQLDKKSAMDCMQYAYDNGVNFFDNAEAYASGESEILMGEILKNLTGLGIHISFQVKFSGEENCQPKKDFQRNMLTMHVMRP